MRRLGVVAVLAMWLAGCANAPAQGTLESHAVHAQANPILSDGRDYTTDPAPLVADAKLYIITGRDMAAADVNDFIMPEWQMLVTDDPASGDWVHYPHFARPEAIFRWAEPNRAYAAQIVRGPDKRYYLYAPMLEAHSPNADGFAIGVAVADSPLGPWQDAHPAGPVVSQSVPVKNDIQNIDPTVLVDGDGRVFLYWGTFGRLKGVELERDMVTFKGTPVDVSSLPGFFEASWIFKRKGVYYLAYAGNRAGPDSDCTEAVYYACIAYGTAASPLGPWTYRGVILDPVSSTTSHPGIVDFKGQWYIAYHTADAKDGGHFRRSVAIDKLEWDDSVAPANIRKVVPTRAIVAPVASRNIAPAARVTASNMPVPVQYWLRALNDGKVHANPLPPDTWGTWSPNNPAQQWALYQWDKPVTLNGARIRFWADHPAGAAEGVAPPRAWHLEYWTGSGWAAVAGASGYPAGMDGFNAVSFAPVTTRCLRAVFDASGDGKTWAAVAAQEWEALAPEAVITAAGSRAPASLVCAS